MNEVSIDISGFFVYHLINKGKVVYVGQSTKIIQRLAVHRSDKEKEFDSVKLIEYSSGYQLNIGEFIDIIKHQPRLNYMLPIFEFAIYKTRIGHINKCLDDSGIPFEKYNIDEPDLEVILNGNFYQLWAKRGREDEFHNQLRAHVCQGIEG